MIEIILEALIPIFFVIALGYLAGKRRTIDNHHVGELNALVMQFALPASLFVATATTSREKMLAEGSLFMLLGIAMMVLYIGWYLLQILVYKASHGEAAVQALTVSLPNYAAAGLPIVLAVIGPQATVHVAVAIAAGSILPSPITLLILELSRKPEDRDGASSSRLRKALIQSVTKPIVLAPVLGTLLSLSGLHLGVVVASSLQLIGQAAGGVALFLTGLVLSAQPFQLDGRVTLATLVSNIVQPLLVFGLAQLTGTPLDIAAVAILLAALPSGFFGILFGVSYDVASKESGSMVIASMLCSALTLGVAILLLYPR